MRWILSFELRFAKLWKPLIFTTRLPWRAWCRIWLRKWRHPPLCPHFSPAARGWSRQRRSQTPARPGYGSSTRSPGMVVPRGAQMVLIFQCRNRIHPVFRAVDLAHTLIKAKSPLANILYKLAKASQQAKSHLPFGSEQRVLRAPFRRMWHVPPRFSALLGWPLPGAQHSYCKVPWKGRAGRVISVIRQICWSCVICLL